MELYGFTREKSNPTFLESLVQNIQNKLNQQISLIYPPNSATLLKGLLVGVSADFKTGNLGKAFINAGLSHIVVVSGENITVLTVFFLFLFRMFPIWLRAILVGGIVFLFMSIVGPQPSVLRAGIMGFLSLFFLLTEMTPKKGIFLVIVALGFVLYNPLLLVYDISFQLSFLSVFGMLVFAKPLD